MEYYCFYYDIQKLFSLIENYIENDPFKYIVFEKKNYICLKLFIKTKKN